MKFGQKYDIRKELDDDISELTQVTQGFDEKIKHITNFFVCHPVEASVFCDSQVSSLTPRGPMWDTPKQMF
jgi:hypothetical protein